MATSRNYVSSKGYSPSTLGERSDEEKAKDCQKYLAVLADQRLPWEPAIDNIIAYVNHGRRFITDKDFWDGQQTGQEIYDDTAMLACNKLVDGMVGYLCSRNQPWFGFELPGKFNFPRSSRMRAWSGKRVDEYPQVQRWLQDTQTVSYSAFNRSNFYDVVTELVRDGATNGTAHMLGEEDIERAAIVFTVPHFRECYIAENQWGKVDTCYRVYKMTLRQLAAKFGMEVMKAADNNFENDYKNNIHAEREILHAVFPRQDSNPSRIDAKNKLWESLWVYSKNGQLLGSKARTASNTPGQDISLLSEGGYDSMPIITWRWRKNNDEVYGRGPGHDSFVSVSQLNQMGRTNMITAQMAAEPPMFAYSDMRGTINRTPNSITYMESNRGDIRARMPQTLPTGVQNLPFNLEYSDRVRQVVNEHFHTDVFMMMSQLASAGKSQRMVVEQVMELQGEKAAILGTRVGNLQSEFFNPLIDRVYSIEAAAGRIPTPPDILLETMHGPVEVQYLGPLAQAQTRLTTVRTAQTFLQLKKQVAEDDPTIIHFVNSPRILRDLRDALNAPVDWVYDEKTCAGIVQQINKAAQQQQQIENAPKLAKAAAAMGKAPEAGSALKQLVSGGADTTESTD
jgi:hypothetical protein